MTTQNMIFPGNSAVVNNETIFIDGFRFDICEVATSHYEYLGCVTAKGSSKPAARFFLSVEENFISGYKYAEDWHKVSGECRYDMFCKGKAECKSLIAIFEKEYAAIIYSTPKTPEGQKRLSDKKKFVKNLFGISL